MLGDLKLIFEKVASDPSPLVVILNRFADGLPRASSGLESNGNYSLAGNYIVSGLSFELPMLYTITAWVTESQAQTLLAMWEMREVRRRNSAYWRFVIEDETELFFEEKTAATKTRSEVSGTTVSALNGGCYYYPKIRVDLSRKPVFNAITIGGDRTAIFTLQDVGIKI